TRTTLGDLIQLAGGMRDNQPLQAVAPSGPSEGFLPAQLRLPALLKDVLTDRKIADVASRSPHAEAWVRDFRARRGDCRTIDVRELLLDKQLFMALGFNLGAGIVVYDARVDMLQAARNCLRFFEKESCGKCVPCRLGCQQLVHLAGPDGVTKLAP